MSDVINFDRLWAYGAKGLEYPNDTETSIGFDFLGKEYPTTHLHDVMFQDLDKKTRYLWRQIHHACARYGVTIESTDDETYTNGLGEAINQALLKQIRASEQNTGIIKLATTAIVQAGSEYNMAVSPAQFKNELDRRLKDYTSRNEFTSNWAKLKKIATTGQLEDGEGFLGFARLSDVPRWIRETHDDGGYLYIRSTDGTQTRTGGGYFDLFNDQSQTSFRINTKTGNIDIGIIDQTHVSNLGQVARDNNYNSLSNLPSLGESSKRPIFDTGDVNAIPWDGWSVPTTSVTRALKEFIQNLKNSLKGIAYSGVLNDGTGVLDKAHGGRGRGDDSYDGTWFYANGSPSDVTNQGFVIGSSLSNKICGGSDDGTNLSLSSNINIDTWYGVGIRSSINNYTTTWKHDARSGITRQRGDLYLMGSEEKAVVAPSGWLNMKAPSAAIRLGYGNMEFYNDGGKRHYIDGNGNGWFSGNVEGQHGTFWSTVEVHGGGIELFHKTPFIDWHYDDTSDDYTARLIATARDVLTLQGSHLNIANSLNVGGRITGGGLGNGAYANFGGNSSAWSVYGSDNEIARSSQLADLRNMVDDRVNRLNRFLDKGIFDQSTVEPTDLPWGNTWVPSTGVLRLLVARLWNLKDKYVFDTADWTTIPWDGGALVTASSLRSVKDQVSYLQSRVGVDENRIGSTETILGQDTVRNLRWVRVVNRAVWNGEGYWGAGNGEVISEVHVYGQVDGGSDYVSVSVLQMYRNGNWYTVTQ